ncbi:MAG: tRNA lysidine(34) synthetase TilS, partial [Clostridium paraputrificum]
MKMEKRVLEYILENELLQEKEKVVVGVSGGPDSICLLEVLYRLKSQLEIELVVAHINHMLRGEEANEDEKYVNNFCMERGIEVYSKRININEFAKEQRMSTETAGREARYEFFREVMKKTNSNKIATAHNANDQVETIFMRIMRGTGLEGLTGIPVKRDSIYIRPILFLQREEIEWYCEKNNLNPRIDKSNMERDYSRNKIRLDIIPYMKENFNSDVVKVINRMADTLKEDNELIESVIDEFFFKYCKVEKNYIIIRSDIVDCKSVIINRVIRRATSIISGSGYNIEAKHIVGVKKLLQLGTNKRVDLPNGLYAENVYGDIYIRKVESEGDKYCEEI